MAESEQEREQRYAELEAEYPNIELDRYRQRSRRSILTGGAALAAAAFGWKTLHERPRVGSAPDVLNETHELNERIWRTLFRDDHLAPTFDRSVSAELPQIRVNGRKGMESEFDPARWQLRVTDAAGVQLATHTLDDLRALPKREMTVEHKCIEGWSHVVTWGGVAFTDFLAAFHPAQEPTEFVSMVTPDRRYYVGLEWAAMVHPQTLLAYELEGEPLDLGHGAPLRLATPLKYGIKQIKRIGTLSFTDERPDDFWNERGYDWYAGL